MATSRGNDEITLSGALVRLGIILIACIALWVTHEWELGWILGGILLGLAFGMLDTIGQRG